LIGAGYYLGLDYGTHKIGIAVGQALTGGARGVATLSARGGETDWARLGRLVAEWQPEALVLGLPLDGAGRDTPMSRAVRRFGERLSRRYNLPVQYINERLTSSEARHRVRASGTRASKRRSAFDQAAACLILESFLAQRRQQ
jgi:putative pre-16S rRNA nuclease